MANKKMPLDWQGALDASAGTNDIATEPVKTGEIFNIQRVTVVNETSLTTSHSIRKDDGSREFIVYERDAMTAGKSYTYDVPFYVYETQRVIFRFHGCTAGDRLRVYLSGWKGKATDGMPEEVR